MEEEKISEEELARQKAFADEINAVLDKHGYTFDVASQIIIKPLKKKE